MNTYTVEDIKEYFNYLITKYPNSRCAEDADVMMYRMFENKDSQDYFEKVMKKIKEREEN